MTPDKLTQAMIDEGLLIEAGFAGFMIAVGLDDCPPDQRMQMRDAFFAGSLHLFTSITAAASEGDEITPEDERRMACIQAELDAFGDQLTLRAQDARGQA